MEWKLRFYYSEVKRSDGTLIPRTKIEEGIGLCCAER